MKPRGLAIVLFLRLDLDTCLHHLSYGVYLADLREFCNFCLGKWEVSDALGAASQFVQPNEDSV